MKQKYIFEDILNNYGELTSGSSLTNARNVLPPAPAGPTPEKVEHYDLSKAVEVLRRREEE